LLVSSLLYLLFSYFIKMSYALNLSAWWSVVASLYHTRSILDSHPPCYLLCTLFRGTLGKGAANVFVVRCDKTLLLVGRI
jgi:hypothetical protein